MSVSHDRNLERRSYYYFDQFGNAARPVGIVLQKVDRFLYQQASFVCQRV